MSLNRFAALPNHKSREFKCYLYAMEFSDGVVKVGCTWNPQARAAQLRRQRRKEIAKVSYVGLDGKRAWFRTERLALSICRRIASQTVGHEWFHGLHFGEATNAIKAAARKAEA